MTERTLRSPLTVIGATLACFLVVLALLTAHITSGRQAALPGQSAALVVHRGGKVLRTTASGRVLGPASGAGAAQQGGQGTRAAALVTRASGTPGGGDLRDD